MDTYDIYELMMIPPNKKTEMIIDEIRKTKPNLNLVGDLITLGANIDWQGNDGIMSALHYCAVLNRPEILGLLISAGADVNIQDKYGRTGLHYCADFYRPDIARMLIEAGADLNIQSNGGWTALHECAWHNNLEIAGMLIYAGAYVNIQNNDGKLPYEFINIQDLEKLLKI